MELTPAMTTRVVHTATWPRGSFAEDAARTALEKSGWRITSEPSDQQVVATHGSRLLLRLLGRPLVGRHAPVTLTVSFSDPRLIQATATANPGWFLIQLPFDIGTDTYKQAARTGFNALNELAEEEKHQ
ncbi:MAG: hypothetical protein INR66_00445 [Gordonia polyisoprenivorans]|nr:hypothetical protein [Gordonia polyisoprenivorans]